MGAMQNPETLRSKAFAVAAPWILSSFIKQPCMELNQTQAKPSEEWEKNLMQSAAEARDILNMVEPRRNAGNEREKMQWPSWNIHDL